MDTTLEEYIASNDELQDAVNCVKAQLVASKMGKSLLQKVSAFTVKLSPCSGIEEQDDIKTGSEIWKGPSSEDLFLSLKSTESQNDEDLESLNEDLMQIDLNGNEAENLEESSKDEFDLRQIINKKRNVDNFPSVFSQQWRLREPNVGEKRPAGMPPLVPIALLDKLPYTDGEGRQKNHIDKRNRHRNRWHNKNRGYSQKRFKSYGSESPNKELPKIWDEPPKNMVAGNSMIWQQNVLPLKASNEASSIDLFAKNSALCGNGALMGFHPNLLPINSSSPLTFNSAACNANALNNILRSNLNGIRGYGGRVERSSGGSQNDNILQRALRLFLNSINNCNSTTALNANGNFTNTNQTTSLAADLKKILQQGITIKLAPLEGGN